MRLITPLVLTALSIGLAACGNPRTVTIPVATDSRIFQGAWSGIPKLQNTTTTAGAVKINAAATYVSSTTYTITGTLTMDGATYSLDGEGKAFSGAQLTPQWSQVSPQLSWEINIKQAGQKAGLLSGRQYVTETDTKINTFITRLLLNGQIYDLELNRLP